MGRVAADCEYAPTSSPMRGECYASLRESEELGALTHLAYSASVQFANVFYPSIAFQDHIQRPRDDHRVEFEWDARKARKNTNKHGVPFEEATTVFADWSSRTISDPTHSLEEGRYLTLGVSDRGRILVVSHTDRIGRIRLISARPATRREKLEYEKQL